MFSKFSVLLLSAVALSGQGRIVGNRTIDGAINTCTDAGSNDTYACSISPAPGALRTGTIYTFKAATANTGAATINFNSLGAKTIKKVAGGVTTDLADNDIRAGQWVSVIYDGTNMQMLSALGNAASGAATHYHQSYSSFTGPCTTGDSGTTTDSVYTFRCVSSAWQAFYKGQMCTPPGTLGSWSNLNTGSATLTTTNGVMNIVGAASAGYSVQGQYQTYTAPYSATALLVANLPLTNYAEAGLGFTNGTAISTVMILPSTSPNSYVMEKWTNSTTYAGSAYTPEIDPYMGGPVEFWVKLRDDATNRTAHHSSDGLHLRRIHTVGRTDFLTPTGIGFFVNPNTSNKAPVLSVICWNVGT